MPTSLTVSLQILISTATAGFTSYPILAQYSSTSSERDIREAIGDCQSSRGRVQKVSIPIIIHMKPHTTLRTRITPRLLWLWYFRPFLRSKITDEIISNPSFPLWINHVLPSTDVRNLLPCLGSEFLMADLTMMGHVIVLLFPSGFVVLVVPGPSP